jgi:hypothetical protein
MQPPPVESPLVEPQRGDTHMSNRSDAARQKSYKLENLPFRISEYTSVLKSDSDNYETKDRKAIAYEPVDEARSTYLPSPI